MNELDKKILKYFPGKAVRKDLTMLMKKGANVPTYVLEFLLGQYCSSDDKEVINAGMDKIRKILSENYVTPDQKEYIKSKIRENGEYTIIDKISVSLCEQVDKYIATLTNLNIAPFEVSSDLVTHNEKLLLGGIWCILRIAYKKSQDQLEEEEDLFEKNTRKKKKRAKKTKYDSPFVVVSLKPIQMPNLNLDQIISAREHFTKDEWIKLILRSVGYEPESLNEKQRMHYLLRVVPFVEKNYNLVELGPRGTGKSYVYSEISPHSILMASGHTTVANMFYNISRREIGLVGSWDCIAFDEVGNMSSNDTDFVQIMKTYMANGNFARGTDAINADASIAFEGNTFRSVEDMLRTSHLFEPFPTSFNNDSAFFDRINAYLPGWETPKLRESLFTKEFGLISDCFSEFCHAMRKYDFTNDFAQYFELNKAFNTRDNKAVTKTFSGLVKLIYPDGIMTKEQIRELLEYSIEGRRRVKEQLKKMSPSEFSDVNLGYIDLETNVETVIEVPEQPASSLIFQGLENCGYVYGIGRSSRDLVGVYRLENKAVDGTGEFMSKNIEGIGYNKNVKDSINAAFNYFKINLKKLININADDYNYSMYFNDMQSKGVCDEVSVAEVVALFSAVTKHPVLPSLVVVGRVVMSGSMMPVTTSITDIITAAINAGAKKILLPEDSKDKFDASIRNDLKQIITPIYYSTPVDAAKKAFGGDEL